MARLFLDLDGVLADFDRGVREVTGQPPEALPLKTMWAALSRAPRFFETLAFMEDAEALWRFCAPHRPTILTGLPLGNWAAPQKVRWAAEHFPGVPIITCMARDKHKHMHEGDVLVDDRENHRAAYEAAGVVFVHHKNAKDSLRQLAEIYTSVAEKIA